MAKTSEVMDTDLMDFMDSRDDWYGITKYGGRYHIEHRNGRIGPCFSIRGVLAAFQQSVTGEGEALPTYGAC